MSDRADEDAQGREPLTALGKAIRALRTEAGMNQEDLASGAELKPPALAAIEAGRAEPTWGELRRLAYAIGTPLERLLKVAEELERGDEGDVETTP
jgi:transcriptional regulator with XRE-family HTH domain